MPRLIVYDTMNNPISHAVASEDAEVTDCGVPIRVVGYLKSFDLTQVPLCEVCVGENGAEVVYVGWLTDV